MNNHISSFLRRGGAILLALALLAILLPTSAFALTGTQGDLTWSLNGGVLSVSGSGPIPDYTDENMAPWYYVASGVNRILVGDGITEIGVGQPGGDLEVGVRKESGQVTGLSIGGPVRLAQTLTVTLPDTADAPG